MHLKVLSIIFFYSWQLQIWHFRCTCTFNYWCNQLYNKEYLLRNARFWHYGDQYTCTCTTVMFSVQTLFFISIWLKQRNTPLTCCKKMQFKNMPKLPLVFKKSTFYVHNFNNKVTHMLTWATVNENWTQVENVMTHYTF